MNKEQFLANEAVLGFTNWLAGTLPSRELHLEIGRSAYVLTPIVGDVRFEQLIPEFYCWRARDMETGNWQESTAVVANLSAGLRAAMHANDMAGDPAAVQAACAAIFRWGGERNSEVGASKFVADLGAGVCEYLRSASAELDLDHANLATGFPHVLLMNSMMTKVHAFYATDGLPIYDSRVAAAVSALVEIWRRTAGIGILPELLKFPEAGGSQKPERKLSCLFPDAPHPGRLSYSGPSTAAWSAAKVRLGWLLARVLQITPRLFQRQQSRMRSFEAALFMVGYDLRCLAAR